MHIKPFFSYMMIAVMFINSSGAGLLAGATGASLFFTKVAYASSDTPKLDELKAKYDLTNPNKNHQNDVLDPKLQALIDSPPESKDMQPQIDAVYASPVVTKDLQLATKYPTTVTFDDYKDLAVNLSTTHGQPSGTIIGNSLESLDVTYSRTGTRTFVRNPATGALELKVIEGVEKVNGISNTEMFSSELDNSTLGFEQNKENMYGDGVAVFTEGKTINDNFKDPTTGKNASARGYRALTEKALQANSTTIDEDTPWLQASFTELGNAQDPNQWLSACSETTTTNTTEYGYGTSTEHRCQDTSQSSFDFCEVERNIKVPAAALQHGLKSCGQGCYEYMMTVGTWKTSKCRDTYAEKEADPALLDFKVNFNTGVTLKKVSLVGIASDHFRFQLNGSTIWESNGKLQGPTGNIAKPGCNISPHDHHINTDVSTRAISIVGEQVGLKTLSFRGDLKWKRAGEMFVTVRIELDGAPELFTTTFDQYPEGCYDALSEEDKLTRGLVGVYEWSELGIDHSQAEGFYTCTSLPETPLCNAGETLFGNVKSETCLSTPTCTGNTVEECTAAGFLPGTYLHVKPYCIDGVITENGASCEYASSLSCGGLPLTGCGVDEDGGVIYATPVSSSRVDKVCTYTSTNCPIGWSTTLPAIECPLGGTVDKFGICSMPSLRVQNCADGLVLRTKIRNGITNKYCTRTPTDFQDHPWSCGNPLGFDDTSCQVSLEDYLDENNAVIKTIDNLGFPISPILDDENQPVTFRNYALCSHLIGEPVEPEEVEVPLSFCSFDEYENLEEGDREFPDFILDDIPPWYVGDLGEKTFRVNLKGYRCDPTYGQLRCYIDPETGEKVCLTWDELRAMPDKCEPYKTDSTCAETSRDCTEGWLEEVTGRCMAETVVYECSEQTTVPYTTTQTTNVCDAMLPCSGGECDIGTEESNEKFVEAMVAGSILDNVQGDSSCTVPTDPSTCTIFAGEFEYCSWEVSGLGSDCCASPGGVDILAYVATARAGLEIKQMLAAGRFGEGAAGAYESLSAPITDAADALAQWASDGIRSVGESVFGNKEAVSNGVGLSESVSLAVEQITQQVYQLIYDVLPDALSDLVFTQAVDAAGEATGELLLDEAITSFFGNVMFIYTVYNLTKIALTLLTACDDNELDMGLKIAQRQCFLVGDRYCSDEALGVCYQRRQNYCCYSSILARIIMKESYNQLSIDPLPYGIQPNMHNGESAASCPGLTADQLASVDFSAPSMELALQEWTGLLLDAGEIPSETSEEYLTGGAVVEERTDCPVMQKPILTCHVDPVTLTEICDQARDATGQIMYEDVPTDCGGKLTGGNSIWNAGERVIASERIAGPDGYIGTAADRTQENKDQMKTLPTNIDCSSNPKPPVCFFGFDPVEPRP